MYVCMPKRDGNRAEVEAFFPVPMFSLTPDQGWHQTAAKPPESEPEVLLDSEVEARVLRLLRSTPELPSGVFALQTNKLLGLALISLPWSKADVLLLRLNSLFPSGAQPKSRSEKGCLIEELGGSNITAVGAVCACAYAHTHMPCAEHRVDIVISVGPSPEIITRLPEMLLFVTAWEGSCGDCPHIRGMSKSMGTKTSCLLPRKFHKPT